MNDKTLVLIPARGGSKRIPHKNSKLLCGKPLICYSIDAAREIFDDIDICVSTDDREIIGVVEQYGLKVPFVRPEYLSNDTAQTTDVVKHALEFYAQQEIFYQRVVLLQPTSPLRRTEDIKGAMGLFTNDIDMVVSVVKSHAAGVMCEENDDRYLNFSLRDKRSLDEFYEYNGAVYIINAKPILAGKSMLDFEKRVKYVMPHEFSVDIDEMLDWLFVKFLMSNKTE